MILTNLANSVLDMGDSLEAESIYLEALSIASDFGPALSALGNIYMARGDYERALEVMIRGAKMDSPRGREMRFAMRSKSYTATLIRYRRSRLSIQQQLLYVSGSSDTFARPDLTHHSEVWRLERHRHTGRLCQRARPDRIQCFCGLQPRRSAVQQSRAAEGPAATGRSVGVEPELR